MQRNGATYLQIPSNRPRSEFGSSFLRAAVRLEVNATVKRTLRVLLSWRARTGLLSPRRSSSGHVSGVAGEFHSEQYLEIFRSINGRGHRP